LTTHGIECFLADYSVDKPAIDNSLFNFTKKYLGNKNDYQTIRLESWIKDNKSDDEMLLQMDIEGAEYQVILDTPSETLRRFRILVIEFHT
jgi:FkbM family methyltransferase